MNYSGYFIVTILDHLTGASSRLVQTKNLQEALEKAQRYLYVYKSSITVDDCHITVSITNPSYSHPVFVQTFIMDNGFILIDHLDI